MNCKVVYPYHQHRQIDRQYPEHDDKDRMCVVVKIPRRSRSLRVSLKVGVSRSKKEKTMERETYTFPRKLQRTDTGCNLNDTSHHIRELIRNKSCNKEQKHESRHDSSSWATGRKRRGH